MRRLANRYVIVALAAVGGIAAGGGGYVLLDDSDPDSSRSAFADAERSSAPVLVPRRRRPPQVVEPEAGAIGGASAEPEIRQVPPPRGAGAEERPAGGVPSDAAIKAELAELQRASDRFSLDELDFSDELLDPSSLAPGGWRRSVASVYTDYGGPLACGGRLAPERLGVAHKSAPCGTLVTFRYRGRAIRIPVIDRGPYIRGREWDFTGAAAKALRFPGLGTVEWLL